MRPVLIEMEGFGSYLMPTHIDLAGVDLAAIVGSNGAGKSTLLDAVTFALFGRTRADADSVVSTDADTAKVSVWFDAADGSRWRVTRTRTSGKRGRTGLSLEREDDDTGEWVSHTGHTIAATEDEIRKVVGGSFDMIAATVFAAQGDISRFTSADPAERKQILAELLGLDRFDQLAVAAKDRAHQAHVDLTTLTARAGDLDNRLVSLDADQEALANASLAVERAAEALSEAEDAAATAGQQLADSKAAADAVTDLESQLGSLRLSRQEAIEAATRDRQRLNAAKTRAQQAVVAAEAGLAKAAAADATIIRVDTELAGLDEEIAAADAAVEAVVEKGQAAKAAIAGFEAEVNTARQQLDTLTETEGALRRSVDAGEGECWACHQSLSHEHIETMLASLAADRERCESQIATLETKIAETNTALEVTRGEWSAAKNTAAGLRERRDSLAAEKATATAVRDRRSEYEETLADAKNDLERLDVETAEVEASLARLAEPSDDEVAVTKRLAEARSAAEGVQALVAARDAATTTLRAAQSALNEANAEKGRLVERVNSLFQDRAERERLTVQIEALTQRRDIHTTLTKAFGRDGIPALVLEGVVPELSDEMNDVLSTLSLGALEVELSTSRSTKTGKQIDRLEVIVSDDQGPRPYSTFSGGERLRVDLALRVALARLMARRSGAPVRTLVLDEAWGALDEQGVAATVECLRALTDEFPLVLTVTHEPEVAAGFPTVIEVTKHADGSAVEVRT